MSESLPQGAEILVQTDAVSKYFRTPGGLFSGRARLLRAVENVSIHVKRGETMALVGESGSGKSTLGRLILRLHDPSSGRIYFEGKDITHASTRQLRPLRKRMQVIFQDPYSSLNPRMSVRQTLAEPLRIHELAKSREDEAQQLESLLGRVGLRTSVLDRYPTSFRVVSGNASASPGRWRSVPSSSFATSPSARSTSRSRPRSSTCS